MSNEKQNPENHVSQPLNMGGVSGSKSERILKVKQLFENGLIFFDKERSIDLQRYIISYDKGSGKDYSVTHSFYCP
jgi:hypothetical protein